MDAPRQLSANGEHGFPKHPNQGRVKVFVGGDMLRNVVAYDLDAGWAEVITHDDNGALMRLGEGWGIRRYLGKVKVFIT